tara:strand:+ start:611 stop:1081 length:471 start_codon:yes stop_codon:yes gene_type:complete
MKKIKLIILLIFSLNFAFCSNSLKEIRDLYYKVNLEEKELKDFENYLLNNVKITNPELEGYKAVLWFLKARDYYNPYKKYESFTKGKKELEFILKKYPNNIELHFLRLTIQDNLPSFLGYNNNISEDEKFIKEKVKEIKNDPDLVQRIVEYLAQKK